MMHIDDEYIKEMSHKRRIRQQALVILNRGRNAGIPDKYLRVSKADFQAILDDKYHSDVNEISDIVFNNSASLLQIPYILIDGGNNLSRMQAGYTILFRMIACDKNGIYERCSVLSHKVEDINGDGILSRNEYIDRLRKYDAMFLGEVKAIDFNQHLSGGSYVDELLGYRADHSLPTILSFSNPLCTKNEMYANVVGDIISSLSVREFAGQDKKTNPTNNFFRIRVKNI